MKALEGGPGPGASEEGARDGRGHELPAKEEGSHRMSTSQGIIQMLRGGEVLATNYDGNKSERSGPGEIENRDCRSLSLGLGPFACAVMRSWPEHCLHYV